MPKIPIVDVDPNKRRLLTRQNLKELNITEELLAEALQADEFKVNVQQDGRMVSVSPEGISINENVFGKYSGPTAAERGWMSYFAAGAPLVEERADIIQPPADLVSAREYQNRSTMLRNFSDLVAFEVSNTLSWSLEGRAQLTLQGSLTAELTGELHASIANSLAQMSSSTSASRSAITNISHNHPNNTGSQTDVLNEQSSSQTNATTVTDTTTITGVGKAMGSATGLAALMLGIAGTVSGSVTTRYNTRSTLAGDIPANTMVQTQASQRRQIRNYIYEFPINFAGEIALQYPVEVPVRDTPPQPNVPRTARVIARNISGLGLTERGYRPKGVAELVSVLAVDHIVFDGVAIPPDTNQEFARARTHYIN